MKVTVPVGTVAVFPVVVSVTVAVSVSGWPMPALAGLVETATAVVSPGLVLGPLTETCCVLPARLRLLSVTVMPALRLDRLRRELHRDITGRPRCQRSGGKALVDGARRLGETGRESRIAENTSA